MSTHLLPHIIQDVGKFGVAWIAEGQRQGLFVKVLLTLPVATHIPVSGKHALFMDLQLFQFQSETERISLIDLAADSLCWLLNELLHLNPNLRPNQRIVAQAVDGKTYERFGFRVYSHSATTNYLESTIKTILKHCTKRRHGGTTLSSSVISASPVVAQSVPPVTPLVGTPSVSVPSPKWLQGPVSMTEHVRADGSTVVVLGDFHGRLPGVSCGELGISSNRVLPVEDIFALVSERMAKTYPNAIVDVHLEIPFATKDVTKSTYNTPIRADEGYLFYDTYNKLLNAKCLDSRVKSSCKWPNMRFHYDDVRAITPALLTYRYLVGLMGNVISEWYQAQDESRADMEHLALFKYGLENTRLSNHNNQTIAAVISNFKTWKASDFNVLLVESRVQKEISQVKDPLVLKVLQGWSERSREQLIDRIQVASLLEYVLTTIQTLPKGLVIVDDVKKSFDIHLEAATGSQLQEVDEILKREMPELEAEHDNILDGLSMLQDMYMFARMFKSTLAIPIRSIVFVGDAHARKLRSGLENSGFQTIISVGTDAKIGRVRVEDLPPQCLALDKIGWPWFAAASVKAKAVDVPQKLGGHQNKSNDTEKWKKRDLVLVKRTDGSWSNAIVLESYGHSILVGFEYNRGRFTKTKTVRSNSGQIKRSLIMYK